MRVPVFVVLLGILADAALAFQCSPVQDCGAQAADVLENAAKFSERVLLDSTIEMVNEVSDIYNLLIPVFDGLDLADKTIAIGNHVIKIDGEVDPKQAAEILKELNVWLQELTNLTGELIPGGVESIRLAIQNIISKLLGTSANNAYGLVDLTLLRSALDKALDTFRPIVKTVVLGALDRVGNRIDSITDKIGFIVKLIPGVGDKWDAIKAVIDAVIQKIKAKAESKLTDTSFDEYDGVSDSEDKRAIAGIWEKVKTAADKLGDNIRDRVKATIELYKPKIIDGLNNVKEVVIGSGKQIIIQVKGEIVRIITDALTTQSDVDNAYAISDVWAKVKSAAVKLAANVRTDVMKILEDYKPKVLADLNQLKETVLDAGKKILISIRDNVVRIIVAESLTSSDEPVDVEKRSLQDVWAKVKAAAENLNGQLRDQVKSAIEKFKPKIIDGLNTVKQVVIDSGKKIVITIHNEVVRIIAGADIAEGTPSAAYGITDSLKSVWSKVKAAASNLASNVKDIVIKIIEEAKPQIIAELEKMKEVLIQAGKKVLIQIVGDVARIIVGDAVAYSDDAFLEKRAIRDVWGKVTAAIKKFNEDTKNFFKTRIDALRPKIVEALEKTKTKFGEWKQVIVDGAKNVWVKVDSVGVQIAVDFNNVMDKVRAAAEKLDDKVRDQVKAAIAKFEPLIIDGLNSVKQVILDSGKKIVITIRDELVRIVAGADIAEDKTPTVAYGFMDKLKQTWEKVKAAASSLAGKTKTIVLQILEENKPFIMEQLGKIKEALVEAGKKVLIQVTDEIVKVIVGESVSYSDDSVMHKRSLTDLWTKVTNAVTIFNRETRDFFKSKLELLKPKIVELLEKSKVKFGEWKEIVVAGAEKLWVKMDAAGVKIVADIKNVWGKVVDAAKDMKADARSKIEEYKPVIIEALNKFKEDASEFKEYVIEGAQKIYVRITAAGVKVFEDTKDVLSKVNAAAEKLKDDVRAQVKVAIEKYKPLIVERLNQGKEVAIDLADRAKKVIIDAKGGIVRIITDALEVFSDEEFAVEERGLSDVWDRIVEAMKQLESKIKESSKKVIDEYTPKIVDALQKMKEIAIEAGKQIVIKVTGEVVKVVVDGKVIGA